MKSDYIYSDLKSESLPCFLLRSDERTNLEQISSNVIYTGQVSVIDVGSLGWSCATQTSTLTPRWITYRFLYHNSFYITAGKAHVWIVSGLASTDIFTSFQGPRPEQTLLYVLTRL